MEVNNKEVEAIQAVVIEVREEAVSELTASQLALIGGGCGEVVFG